MAKKIRSDLEVDGKIIHNDGLANNESATVGQLKDSSLDVDFATLKIDGELIYYLQKQENSDVDSASTETIATIPLSGMDAVFFDYVIKKGTNLRAGNIIATHDGTNINTTEYSTIDLGTVDVTLSVIIDGTDLKLTASATSDD